MRSASFWTCQADFRLKTHGQTRLNSFKMKLDFCVIQNLEINLLSNRLFKTAETGFALVLSCSLIDHDLHDTFSNNSFHSLAFSLSWKREYRFPFRSAHRLKPPISLIRHGIWLGDPDKYLVRLSVNTWTEQCERNLNTCVGKWGNKTTTLPAFYFIDNASCFLFVTFDVTKYFEEERRHVLVSRKYLIFQKDLYWYFAFLFTKKSQMETKRENFVPLIVRKTNLLNKLFLHEISLSCSLLASTTWR